MEQPARHRASGRRRHNDSGGGDGQPERAGFRSGRARPNSTAERTDMNSFEWSSPRDIAQAAGVATTTVAAAMVSQSGRLSTDGVGFKAGGIDLLDLMKEGLLVPRGIVNLREIPDLAVIAQADDGGVHIGANVTLAQLAADPVIRSEEHTSELQSLRH